MNYDELIQLISSAEASDMESKSVSADVYDIGPQLEIKEYDSDSVEKTIMFIENAEAGSAQAQTLKSGDQQASALTQLDRYNVVKSAQMEGIKKGGDAIAKELGSLVSKTGGEFSKYVKSKSARPGQPAQKQPLVLVNLSIQDQIGELEKISALIDKGSMSQDQLAIVKLEVGGLMKNRGKPVDEFQKQAADIRDSRLSEVARKLGL